MANIDKDYLGKLTEPVTDIELVYQICDYLVSEGCIKGQFIVDNDGKDNVNGDVYLDYYLRDIFKSIPVFFGLVAGSFYCPDSELISLTGCPDVVEGNFTCYYNGITSLVGGPTVVDGNYNCRDNKLT
jgi:hypothetical protein